MNATSVKKNTALWVFGICLLIGGAAFAAGLFGRHPERAWQAYLINLLVWSGIAQGGLLFSVVMHLTRARWSGRLAALSEMFAAFFPVSFILFVLLFLGRAQVFPWLHAGDLHGKEVWLNLPFLFTRDAVGLIALYVLGLAYCRYARQYRQAAGPEAGRLQRRMTLAGGFYTLFFAVVLSLIGYDLVMSMDPHWISTLFGAYTFVKAFYIGLGGLIILAVVLHLSPGHPLRLREAEMHDIGKLFFAFGLLWADFFYVQLMVIWYGNIPEETAYVIERTMLMPWRGLAWTVFAVGFLVPFFVLLNKRAKTAPWLMLVLCGVVIGSIWLEHLLLLGPALSHGAGALPLGVSDGLITLGFLGLMGGTLARGLRRSPPALSLAQAEGD